MKNNFLKNFVIVACIFFLAIMGQIFLPSMGIFFLGQWPIFIFIFTLNFFQKGKLPLFFAFLAGILIDFISGLSFGVFTLSFFTIALIAQASQQRLQSSSPASFALSFVVCVAIFFGLTRLFLYVFKII